MAQLPDQNSTSSKLAEFLFCDEFLFKFKVWDLCCRSQNILFTWLQVETVLRCWDMTISVAEVLK